MALLFADGYDLYSGNAELMARPEYFGNVSDSGQFRLNATAGRWGGGALEWYRGSSRYNHANYIAVPAYTGSLITNFSFRWFKTDFYCRFRNTSGASILRFEYDSTDTLKFTDNAGTLLATVNYLPSTWGFIEIKFDIAAQTVSLVVNGLTILDSVSASLGTEDVDRFETGSTKDRYNGSKGVFVRFDDWVFLDTSGTVNNDMVGNIRIATQTPAGAGSVSGFSVPAGVTDPNWMMIDELSNDADTTYVEGASAGTRDLYTVAPLPTDVTINGVLGVQVTSIAKATDVGPKEYAPVVASGASSVLGTSVQPPMGYSRYYNIFETNPATGAPFTPAEADTMEIGFEVTL